MPTEPPRQPTRRLVLARAGRQLLIAVVVAFVALGLAGVWGSHSRQIGADGGGYHLTVTYPSATRAGVPIDWAIEVRKDGAFSGPVEVATTLDYLDLFDVSSIEPEPSSTRTSGDMVVWEFEQPDGEALRVEVDAAAEPAVHWGRTATTEVLVEGSPVVGVRYRTRFLP